MVLKYEICGLINQRIHCKNGENFKIFLRGNGRCPRENGRVPGGRPYRVADHAAWPSNVIAVSEWPTIPDGRLFRVAVYSEWPTVPSGRPSQMLSLNSTMTIRRLSFFGLINLKSIL